MAKPTPVNLSKNPDTIVSQTKEPLSKQLEQKKDHLAKAQDPDKRLQNNVTSINLKSSDDKIVALTSSKLDSWFATIEKNNKKKEEKTPKSDDLIASQLLSRFGLKNSNDVIKFLHTPAGEDVLSMIGDKLAEIASIQEYQRQELIDAQTRHSRMLAYLLLGLLYKKDAKARHLNDAIQEQIDKTLQHGKELADAPPPSQTHTLLREQLDTLNESAKYLQSALDDKNLALEQHNKALHALKQEGAAIDERYNILEKNLQELDSFAHPETLALTDGSHEQEIAKKINELEESIDNHANTISELLADKKPHEARKLMHNHEGLHLQIGGLKHILAVRKGEKKFFDAEGQETSFYRNAAFILTPDLKVVKDNGKFYILGAHQNLDDLSETQKAQAQSKFNRLRPEISCVQNLVRHNCKLEKESHGGRMDAAEKHGHTLTSEIRLLRNQLHQVKAAQANIANELNKANPDLKKAQELQNAMQNIPSANRAVPPAQAKALEALKVMQPNPTPQNIRNFTNILTNTFGQVDQNIRKDLNKIVPGKPIPPALMVSLNQNIYKLKLPTNAPAPAPEKQAPERQAPTPFKTKPTPY